MGRTLLGVLIVALPAACALPPALPPSAGTRAAGAPSSSSRDRSAPMADVTDSIATRLVGAWRRTDGTPCATPYPARLDLQPDGLYRGTAEPAGSFVVWDVGRWRVEGETLALSTANDAVVRYPFTLEGVTLEVREPGGCRLRYAREP